MRVRRTRVALLGALTLLATALSSGACKDGADPSGGGAAGAGGSAGEVPVADSVVYTCEIAVVQRGATPFAQAEASAVDQATARARAIPEACRKAGGGAACGAEEAGWETRVECSPTLVAVESGSQKGMGVKGWSCVATAVEGGVARVEAESPRSPESACEMALVAACEVARGGEACRASKRGWQVIDRVRGKKVNTH